MRKLLTTTALALMLGGAAIAGDFAFVIGNESYDALPRNPNADNPARYAGDLDEVGVKGFAIRNADEKEMDRAFGEFIGQLAADSAPSRVAVVLAGQFAETANDTYFLPTDSDEDIDLNRVRETGLALSTVLAVLSAYPGEALLVLGEGRDSGDLGAFLSYGITLPSVPQGVTVLQGTPADVGDFVEDTLIKRALPTVGTAENQHGLIASGYAPAGRVFFAPESQASVGAAISAPPPVSSGPSISAPETVARLSEADLWEMTRRADTVPAYQRFIQTYPDSPNAKIAQDMIREIETEPFRAERLAEQDLRLSRDAKRSIQRNLTLLEFDPRGIDGLFGRGSRAAIAAWQRDSGFEGTSYLTGNQIALMNSQAERRAAELEEEARLRREQQERDDRAYWEQTGAYGDAPGLRAYLERYPDGVYAEVAQERLRVIEEAAQAEAAERESIAWEQAAELNTVEGYQAFIKDFPNGRLAEEAQARVDAMTRDPAEIAAEERARKTEENLNLSRRTRTLVEDRLAKLGLKPGKVDGEFTDQTRRAIRRYQDARGMTVTGYLNQQTVVRLMADSLFR